MASRCARATAWVRRSEPGVQAALAAMTLRAATSSSASTSFWAPTASSFMTIDSQIPTTASRPGSLTRSIR